ncbi:MAG: type II secretion system protein [Burkholderiales bacterium]|nr:type II secretion system protein [Burkholderiales bacterium]
MRTAMRRQRGATMIIALIMIATITLLVVASFTLSSTNLRSVGNLQVREESLAAANRAIELVLSSAFTDAPTAQEITVDINNDGTTDYTVALAQPTCVKVAIASSGAKTQVGLNMGSSDKTWYTDWDLDATVTDAATGARVRVHQGVRVLLNDTQKGLVCA